MSDLCVIIVSWNTKDYLLSCLESVSRETARLAKEIVVVDNGSRDGSGAEAKKRFPEIHLIENDKNLGFSRAANQGLRKNSWRYALLLNPDTQARGGVIERLVSFMDTHPTAGIAGAQLLNSNGSKQNSIANFPSLSTELLNKSLLRWLFPKKYPGKERNYPEAIEVDSVIGACIMARREAADQVGLLDEDYFLFLEETDWCYRMKKAGWAVYHLPQAEVYHYQGKSAEGEKKRARVEYYRSRYLFFKKHRGYLEWVLLVIGLVLRLGIELLAALIGCLLTLFLVKNRRRRLSLYGYLMWWHMRLCPEGMGLRE